MNLDHELIDKYLSGKMSAADKMAFEDGLVKDPLLKQEVAMQQAVVSAIKIQRKAELKARLNNIQVPLNGGMSLGWKIVAGVAVATSLFTAGYLSFNGKPIVLEKPTTTVEYKPDSAPKIASENVTLPESVSVVDAQPLVSQEPAKNSKKAVQKTDKKTNKTSLPISESDMPVVSQADHDIHAESNATAPNGNISSTAGTMNSRVEVALDSKSEFKFHYKHFNNKLYLLCDFGNKPYDLIELNTKKVHSLYLYFDNQYYELKSNQTDITALKPIKNSDTIKQLETIRSHK